MGQKTAYGFVGGINGQSLNTMAMQGQKRTGNQNVPLNKRVFSANRAQSLNANNISM